MSLLAVSCQSGDEISPLDDERECIYDIKKFGFNGGVFEANEIQTIVENIEALDGIVISSESDLIQARMRCGLNASEISGFDIQILAASNEAS